MIVSAKKLTGVPMREIRIYQSGSYHAGQTIELSPEAGHHVAVVLRMQVGENITLFAGDNREFNATIVDVRKKQVQVHIGHEEHVDRESPIEIHLAQAISKGERMELVMQKAVELGVASITPIISMRCSVKIDRERLAKKVQSWQAIVIAACEQCGRNTVPIVQEPKHLHDFVQESTQGFKLVLNPEASKSWREYTFKPSPITLLIGPEGGLSESEIQLAQEHDFHGLSLGPRILRTETAAITAISLVQAIAGDLS